MTTVFIAGSMNIKHLDPKVKARLDNIVDSGLAIAVGDASGADTAIQSHLLHCGQTNVTVYCSGTAPRNNLGHWPVNEVQTTYTQGSRQFFTAKDLVMAQAADFGLMIWDAKSTGTLSNVIELLARNKKSVVFVNKAKSFVNVGSIEQLELLVGYMSDHAKHKADQKIRLFDRIAALGHERAQTRMFA